MSNTKEIRIKISSIESVIKTTEAMKMISIVKSKKTKDILLHIKKYIKYIKSILSYVLFTIKKEVYIKNKFFLKKNKNEKLFIIITSDRGLCGSFNNYIFERLHNIIQKKHYESKNYTFFPIGKKGLIYLQKKKYNICNIPNINNCFYSLEKMEFFIKNITSLFFERFSSVYVIYNKLKSSIYPKTVVYKLLPISIKNFFKKEYKISPILEPSEEKVLHFLIKKFLSLKFNKIYLKSSYSEHNSRMIAMHKASENAKNIKNNLILNYNKERQTIITKEILEIISSLESLKF
ncbi:ATP synthase F1 subunit gamma [Blattabacterium cuenoti]|uniref:ATP synthase F1 subunit gamma n=1 Tax=Blattabacterium cuenoti TaxID=1653831 RepID=UPI00163BFC50|nr:ATP synthase F1 subunit gamma [Blattabacterium cuenoti]